MVAGSLLLFLWLQGHLIVFMGAGSLIIMMMVAGQAKTKRDTSDSKKGKEVLEMLENVGKVFGVQDVVQVLGVWG